MFLNLFIFSFAFLRNLLYSTLLLPLYITKDKIFALGFGGNDLIGLNRKQSRVETIPKTDRYHNYRRYHRNKLKEDLRNSDWTTVYSATTVSESLQSFN